MRAVVVFILSLIPAIVFGGQLSTASFHGDVVVRSSGPQQMAILLDAYGRGDGHDGLVDHAWVIASETAYADPLSIFLRAARVTSEPGRITVYSAADHTAVVFLFDGAQDDDGWAPAGTAVHRYAGYGISHYKGVLDLPPITSNGPEHTPVPYSLQDPDPWGTGGEAAGGCQSGGLGSNSCSLSCSGTSNCETSCNAGYYSCCYCTGRTAYCRCLRTGG
ncbi:MAG: hypothetical protein QOI24_1971 [Acidobacteriota bacterium]|jgi:hypothetical protein|nr:hypothetical protein [Acidobacteriota bacterium]